MKLYSYVVARDYGFAPNPFHGVCTLATCKPRIRETASIGDWIVGTGSKANCLKDKLVFVMRVTNSITFCEYYESDEFQSKKPNLQGSLKQAFGDNIYHKNEAGIWMQDNSHHSLKDGSTNYNNLYKDTGVDRVLISNEFAYWGDSGLSIPSNYCNFWSLENGNYSNHDIRAGRNHKCCFPQDMLDSFVSWFRSLNQTGCVGEPFEWRRILKSLKYNQRQLPFENYGKE